MYQWIFATVIVFFASVLQASTGFGFAIMATPFLLLVFDSRECIQISIILSFVVSFLLISKIKKDFDKGLLKRLIIGSIAGVPLGLIFYKYVNLDILKMTVSIVILIVTLILIIRSFKTNPKAKDSSDSSQVSQAIPVIDSTIFLKKTQYFVGFCAGLFTTSIGMPGVPLILYYNATNTKKETARSTTLAFFIFVYIISFTTQLITVKTNLEIVASSLILIPVVVLGVFVGNKLFEKINQLTFQRMAYGILLFTGLYMTITSFYRFIT